jgi:hypothetical protein
MGIYRGSLGEMSNKADWASPFFEFIDDNGDVIDLASAEEIYFEIKDPNTKKALIEATLANGKIAMIDSGKFQISLTPTDLKNICEGQYLANLSFTLAGIKHDPVLATISIIEGAGN